MSEQLGENQEQGFIDHLIELRDRLLRMVVAILILFLCLFAFSEEIFSYFAQPLINLMPEGTSMIGAATIRSVLSGADVIGIAVVAVYAVSIMGFCRSGPV